MRRAPLRAIAIATITALTLLVALPTSAGASLSGDVQQGQGLAQSLRSGQTSCASLSSGDFELIGEYAMGRYLADPAAHEAMNRRMAAMIGQAGEERMHVALGHRYAGCAGGPASGWVGAMGPMMFGSYGGPGGAGRGMMGGYEGGGSSYGRGMMGPGSGEGHVGTMIAVLIALGAAALGGGIVALALYRRLSPGLRVATAPGHDDAT
jgi:hypothetical protein